MSLFEHFIICAIAVFRVAEMLVIDDGPFEIFINLRGWFNRAPFDSMGIRRQIANVLACVYCTGLWIAPLFALTFFYSNNLIDFVILFLAIAGLSSAIAQRFGRN